jgi:hypothetical protein
VPFGKGALRRTKPPVEGQPGKYPHPPSWVRTHVLGSVKRKPPKEPGLVQTGIPFAPWDLFRARGDDYETPKIHKDVLTTYSVIGGFEGNYNLPRTLRPWPAKVDSTGALHTISSGLRTKSTYEGTVVTGTPVTILLNPAPSKCILIANDGSATISIQETGFYLSDGVTPDFNGADSASYPAGFVNTEQVEMVALLLTTASATPQAYRVWVYT